MSFCTVLVHRCVQHKLLWCTPALHGDMFALERNGTVKKLKCGFDNLRCDKGVIAENGSPCLDRHTLVFSAREKDTDSKSPR